MALNKTALKSGIKSAMLANISQPTSAQTTEIDTLAGAFADAIDAFVKSGSVKISTPVTPLAVTTPSGPGSVNPGQDLTGGTIE